MQRASLQRTSWLAAGALAAVGAIVWAVFVGEAAVAILFGAIAVMFLALGLSDRGRHREG